MLLMQDIFIAMTDTSLVIIGWTMFELMIHARLMHKVQGEIRQVFKGKKKVYNSDIKDLDYLRPVINETLRLHPPTPLIPRQCKEKCEIGGYNSPVNTKVTINIWKIGRDQIIE
ncbi:putative cytochrome P450 [Helianthus anomalus]